MSMSWKRADHTKQKIGAANVDPDDGNRWKCSACRLPIFSTLFTIVQDSNAAAGDNDNDNDNNISPAIYMHDQCSDNKILPKLEAHPLHPGGDLILHQDDMSTGNNYSAACSRCHSQCGTKFYKCPDEFCGFTLDLSCALPIKIFHQSHPHELTVTRGSSSSVTCTACGTQHQPSRRLKNTDEWGVSYVCSLCDFWIHPDCAVLPNAIIGGDEYHEHPLLLTYEYLGASAGYYFGDAAPYSFVCKICDGGVSEGLGWYTCFHCPYSAHIKCVMYSGHRDSFKPVLLREAQIPGLLHLPMADEHQSLMPSIMKTITSATATDDASTSTSVNKVHEHPLIFHNDNSAAVGVCNACVTPISLSDTFYSCSNQVSCPDFFLHSCCAHLPDTITSPDLFNAGHTLHLLSKVDKHNPFNIFPFEDSLKLPGQALTNGFAYDCKECKPTFSLYLNVVSALMPASITHDAHARSHILRKTLRIDGSCSCCQLWLGNEMYHPIVYECNNCRNFVIHASCALLPDTVTHKFDPHPLKLITTTTTPGPDRQEEEEEEALCEICEGNLDSISSGRWFYGCKECDQSFHITCIPNFDRLSRIKFGFTIRVTSHDCPLACVRALSVDGYKCGHCGDVIRGSDNIVDADSDIFAGIAFECAECYFRIHKECAEKLMY